MAQHLVDSEKLKVNLHHLHNQYLTEPFMLHASCLPALTLPSLKVVRVCKQVPRSQRFPGTFLSHLETLIMTMSDHVFWKSKDMPDETRCANQAIAAFVKVSACTLVSVKP